MSMFLRAMGGVSRESLSESAGSPPSKRKEVKFILRIPDHSTRLELSERYDFDVQGKETVEVVAVSNGMQWNDMSGEEFSLTGSVNMNGTWCPFVNHFYKTAHGGTMTIKY